MIFFSESKKAFIAYGISGNFAVALENPVAENNEELKKCIAEFDLYCYRRRDEKAFITVFPKKVWKSITSFARKIYF